jgi:tripartite-type tricarboxylate transporter receptor subunit TctC
LVKRDVRVVNDPKDIKKSGDWRSVILILDKYSDIVKYVNMAFGLAVKADAPWRTWNEFIAYAKANPGKIRYSTSGVGGAQHLVMERLALKEKIKWTLIPYESGEEAVTALLGNHVEASSQTTTWKKYVDAGRFRLLVFYGEKRMTNYPDVPTLLELGYDITVWTNELAYAKERLR